MSEKPILYLDCSAGLSGDMAAGALAALLDDDAAVLKTLRFLKRHGYEAAVETVKKQDVVCRAFSVRPSGVQELPTEHMHRSLREVCEIINEAGLNPSARALAVRIYEIIAEAEAAAHGTTADNVHFHEVASIPSIADITAFAFCYERLGIAYTVIPSLYEGTGTVQCAHGELEVPVPAVRNILGYNNLPLKRADAYGEILTPTGAAIAAAIRSGEEIPADYVPVLKGCGAGTRRTGLRGYAEAQLMLPAERSQRNG